MNIHNGWRWSSILGILFVLLFYGNSVVLRSQETDEEHLFLLPYISGAEATPQSTAAATATATPASTFQVNQSNVKAAVKQAVGVANQLVQPFDSENSSDPVAVSQYPSAPALALVLTKGDENRVRIIGSHYKRNPFAEVTNVQIAKSQERYTVRFLNVGAQEAEVVVAVQIDFSADGSTSYRYTVESNTSNEEELQLFAGGKQLSVDLSKETLPLTVEVEMASNRFEGSARYALRDGTDLLARFAAQQVLPRFADSARELQIYGFTAAQLDVMYGAVWPDATFGFNSSTDGPYADCYLDNFDPTNAIDPGGNPSYRRESTDCYQRGDTVLQLKQSPKGKLLDALQTLNKYGDPDHSIAYPNVQGEETVGTTNNPREVLRWIAANYATGYGIHGRNDYPAVNLATETQLFFQLATILCYDYDDADQKTFSCQQTEQIAQTLLQVQVGVQPQALHSINTTEGAYVRGYCNGCPISMWEKLDNQVAPALVDKVTMNAIEPDLVGFLPEYEGLILTDAKSVFGFIQAWETYLCKRWDECLPLMPNDFTVVVPVETTLISFPTEGNMRAVDVLSSTGASKICRLHNGVETCQKKGESTNLFVMNANEAYQIDGVPETIRLVYPGPKIATTAGFLCPMGSGGSYCAFAGRPYPYTLLTTSDLKKLATANGCSSFSVENEGPIIGQFEGSLIEEERGVIVQNNEPCTIEYPLP